MSVSIDIFVEHGFSKKKKKIYDTETHSRIKWKNFKHLSWQKLISFNGYQAFTLTILHTDKLIMAKKKRKSSFMGTANTPLIINFIDI